MEKNRKKRGGRGKGVNGKGGYGEGERGWDCREGAEE